MMTKELITIEHFINPYEGSCGVRVTGSLPRFEGEDERLAVIEDHLRNACRLLSELYRDNVEEEADDEEENFFDHLDEVGEIVDHMTKRFGDQMDEETLKASQELKDLVKIGKLLKKLDR